MKLGQTIAEVSKSDTRIKLTSDEKPVWSTLAHSGALRYNGQHGASLAADGLGELFFPSGERYLGNFVGGELDGFGMYWYRCGAVYAGQWKKSQREGYGRFMFPSGATYEGNFTGGSPNGRGVLTYPHGAAQYSGDFVNGTRCGFGALVVESTGARYEGSFEGDRFSGWGTLIAPQCAVTYDGQWSNGLQHGCGTLSTSSASYSGEFKEGKLDGGLAPEDIPPSYVSDLHLLLAEEATLADGDGFVSEEPATNGDETFMPQEEMDEMKSLYSAHDALVRKLAVLSVLPYDFDQSAASALIDQDLEPLEREGLVERTHSGVEQRYRVSQLGYKLLWWASVANEGFTGVGTGGAASMTLDLLSVSPSLFALPSVVRHYMSYLSEKCGAVFDSYVPDCQLHGLTAYDSERVNVEVALALATSVASISTASASAAVASGGSAQPTNQLILDLCDAIRCGMNVLKNRMHPDQILPITDRLLGTATGKSLVDREYKVAATLLASHAQSSRGVGFSGQSGMLTEAREGFNAPPPPPPPATPTAGGDTSRRVSRDKSRTSSDGNKSKHTGKDSSEKKDKEVVVALSPAAEVDLCDVNVATARAYFAEDDLKQSSALIEAVLAVVKKTNHPRLLCEALTLKGNALMADPTSAPLGQEILKQALEVAEKHHLTLSVALIQSILHIFESVFGDKDKARDMQEWAVRTAAEHGCRSLECNINVFRGKALLRQGKTQEAVVCLRTALVLAKRCGSYQKEALCESSLGATWLKNLNRPDRSLDHLQRARALYASPPIQKPQQEALQMHMIGCAHMKLKQWEAAHDTLKSALAIATKSKANKVLEASIADAIKDVKALAGPSGGEAHQQRSLFADPENMKKLKQASDLSQRAAGSFKNGEYAKALSEFRDALPLYTEVKSTPSVVSTMFSIVNTLLKMRDTQAAKEQLWEALRVCKGAQDDQNAAQALIKLATIHKEAGESEEAVATFEEALEIVKTVNNLILQGTCYMHLGTLYTKLARPKDAVRNFEKSLGIARATQNLKSQSQVQLELARSYFSLGDFMTAIQLCEESLEVCRTTRNRNLEGVALFNISVFCVPIGQITRAVECCEQSIEIAKELRSKESEATREKHLANLKSKLTSFQLGGTAATATATPARAAPAQKEDGAQPRKSVTIAPPPPVEAESATEKEKGAESQSQQQGEESDELLPEGLKGDTPQKRQRDCCGGACATQ